MKVRVPGRQFAAAARETPWTKRSGSDYSDYSDYIAFTVYDLFIFFLYVGKVGNTQKEERKGGSRRGKAPDFRRGRWR